MGKLRYAVDIDLQKNQLLNAVVQNLASAPAGGQLGQIYYNTGDNNLYVNVGVDTWITASGLYNHPTYTALSPTLSGANVLATFESDAEGHVTAATTRLLTLADLGYTGDTNANNYVHATHPALTPTLTGANVLATLTSDTEGHLTGATTRALTLSDLGYTGATDANNYSHPTFAGNDLGAALTGAAVISDVDVNTDGHVTGFSTRNLTAADVGAAVINDSVTNTLNTWSSQKIQDELDAINSTVAGALIYQTGYDASTNTPNLDSSPTAGTVLKGYTYTVTVAGTFFTEEVQTGDMIIAEVDDPATLADWTVVNKNIPDIVDATDVDKGIIRIGTQAEVNAGSLTNVAVTPATLVAFYNAQQSGSVHKVDIGNGASTDIDIAHTLGEDVMVQVFDNATKETIITEVRRTTTTNVRITCNTAPTTNQYRVLIKEI